MSSSYNVNPTGLVLGGKGVAEGLLVIVKIIINLKMNKMLAESVTKKKKTQEDRELKPKEDEDLFEKKHNSVDLPIS